MHISGIDKPIVEHRAILEAIIARDPKRAVGSMAAHLRTAESNLKELKRESGRVRVDTMVHLRNT